MPTWKYNASKTSRKQFTVDGRPVVLSGGDNIESEKFADHAAQGLTLVSNTPLWTPYVDEVKTVTAAGAGTETQAIDPETVRLRIVSVSDGITVSVRIHTEADYVAAHEMIPALSADLCPVDIETNRKVKDIHLVFTGAGSVVIAEMKE